MIPGVWSLESFMIHRENGEIFNWPGKQSGTLIYTDNGYVSVAQNREPIPNPTMEDKARISNFYTGTYELDLDNSRIFHTGLQSSVPSVIGKKMQRELKILEDGRLEITGLGLKEHVTLIWSKVSS